MRRKEREERTKGEGKGRRRCTPTIPPIGSRGWRVSSSRPSPLYSELGASLGYRRHCLKENKTKPEAHRCQLMTNLCIYLQKLFGEKDDQKTHLDVIFLTESPSCLRSQSHGKKRWGLKFNF